MSRSIRIIFDILVLIFLFILPWWIPALLTCIGLFLFDQYIEIIFCGFLIDVLSPKMTGIAHYEFTLIAVGIYIALLILKDRMRW